MRRSSETVITGWRAILLAPILVPIALLAQLWPGGRTIDRTPEDVAGFLRDFLDGTGGEWDWDGFESCPITDAELDWIRKRAAMAGPPDPDIAKLSELLEEAEGIVARRTTTSLAQPI